MTSESGDSVRSPKPNEQTSPSPVGRFQIHGNGGGVTVRLQRGRFREKKQKREVGGSAGTHLDAAFIPTVALLRVQADEAHLREERSRSIISDP